MKIDYKILWLDDKIESVVLLDYQGDIEELRDYIKLLGFKETIDFVRTEKDLFDKLDENIEYDLIMTDYHLDEIKGNTRNGDDIIKTIRERDIFTEIMFYSAQGEVKDTDRLDRITFFESYRVLGDDHYEKIFRKAKELIELTVRKFQNIVAMRGMIMHETSSLDVEMIEIIKKSLKNDSINFEEVSVSIYDQLIELFTQKTEFVQECKRKKNFNQLTKDTFVYSAKYKILTLSKILEDLKIADFSIEYDSEINSIRNKFAHAVLEKDDNGREFFKHKEDGIDFNEELCKVIRENILKHKSNLDELKERV